MGFYSVSLSAHYIIGADNEGDAKNEAINQLVDEIEEKGVSVKTISELFRVCAHIK